MAIGRIPVVYAGSENTGSTLIAPFLDGHPAICCIGHSIAHDSLANAGPVERALGYA